MISICFVFLGESKLFNKFLVSILEDRNTFEWVHQNKFDFKLEERSEGYFV